MLLTHSIISRALEVSIEHISQYTDNFNTKESFFTGFLNYVESFSTVLSVHHHLETDEIFPYFKKIIPEAPYELLNEQHKVMENNLKEIKCILSNLREKDKDIIYFRQLEAALSLISENWYPHIKIESIHFSPVKLENLINTDDMSYLHQKLNKYNMDHWKPDYLIVPFILYNLNPNVREIWAQELPKIFTEKLIPHTWKPKWESMKPFLLPK
jgi:hypothetical protein